MRRERARTCCERACAREERIEMSVHKRGRRWNEPDSERASERGRESDASKRKRESQRMRKRETRLTRTVIQYSLKMSCSIKSPLNNPTSRGSVSVVHSTRISIPSKHQGF